MIRVTRTGTGDPLAFTVEISESGSESRHEVTLSKADHERLTKGACSPERCVEAAFRFLLDREPKEAILARFDVSVIPRYFPAFEEELPRYFAPDAAHGERLAMQRHGGDPRGQRALFPRILTIGNHHADKVRRGRPA